MAMVAAAGAVAEYVWCGDADFLRDEGDDPWHEAAIMSITDWELSGCAPGEPDAALTRAVAKVIDLLSGPLRAELHATARRLIVDRRPGSHRPAFSGGADTLDDDIPF